MAYFAHVPEESTGWIHAGDVQREALSESQLID
jgi:hypothetical protein